MKLTDYANPVYTLSQSCTLVRVRTLLELCEDAVLGQQAYDALVSFNHHDIGDWHCYSESKSDAVADARAILAKPFTRPTQQYDRAVATAVLDAWGDEFPVPTPALIALLDACKATDKERIRVRHAYLGALGKIDAKYRVELTAVDAAHAAACAALAEFEYGKV